VENYKKGFVKATNVYCSGFLGVDGFTYPFNIEPERVIVQTRVARFSACCVVAARRRSETLLKNGQNNMVTLPLGRSQINVRWEQELYAFELSRRDIRLKHVTVSGFT
jgi:hypothetical protein